MSGVLNRLATLSSAERAEVMARLRASGGRPAAGGTRPLSEAEQRMWLLGRLEPDSPAYHLSAVLRLNGPLDADVLRRCLAEITARHAALRTGFVADEDGAPVARVLPECPPDLSVVDLSEQPGDAEERAREEFVADGRRPFALDRAPLVRHRLYRLGVDRHLLAVVAHHLVCDGWSFGVFTEELRVLYEAFLAGLPSPLRPVPPAREPLERADSSAYWRDKLGGTLPVLDLPTDRPRPQEPSSTGRRHGFAFPPEFTAELRAAALGRGTVYSLLLGAFAETLRQVGGRSDVVVGAPVSGRGSSDEQHIGLFVNTLPLRLDLSGATTFGDAFRHATAVLREAVVNEMPFGRIIAAVNPPRATGRPLLRQTAFSLQPAATAPHVAGGVVMSPAGPEEFHLGTSPLDLSLHLREHEGAFTGCLEYRSDLFDATTVARWAELFQDNVRATVRTPDAALPPPAAPEPGPTGSNPTGWNPTGWNPTESNLAESNPTESNPTESNLTESQLLLYFGTRTTPGVRLYYEYVTALYHVGADLEPERFRRAFERLVANSDALRTTFHEVDGVPVSRVRPPAAVALDHVDLSGEPDPAEAARRWARERSAADLDLTRTVFDSALLRLGPAAHAWYLNVHHGVCDAWSMSLILRTASDYYELDAQGRLDEAAALPPFADHVARERELRRAPRPADTPGDRVEFYREEGAPPTTRTERVTVDLGAERSRRVRDLTRTEGATSPATVLAGVLFAYLYRVGAGTTPRVATPFTNRTGEFRDTIGLFMNIRPLDAALTAATPFRDVVGDVQRAFLEAARHQGVPLRNPQDAPTYDVYFNYQNASFSGFTGRVSFELLDTGHSRDRLAVQVRDLADDEAGRRFVVDFDFNTACFDDGQRVATAAHYLRLLDALLDDPTVPVGAAPMLSDDELRELESFNDTARPYDLDVTLPELFARQVRATPDLPAVRFEGRTLSYAELDAAADALARRLPGPGGVVAVCLERSVEMVVALLAVVKAGAAYLPIDPATPAERARFMLADGGAEAVLVTDPPGWLSDVDLPLVVVGGDAGAAGHAEPKPPEPDDPAYLIHTSGSTGLPKCVVITHRAIANRLLWMQEEYDLGPADRVLQKTPFTFDVSVWEFFWTLTTGACLVVARPGGQRDPGYLAGVIDGESVTVAHFVPSMLSAFLEDDRAAGCRTLRRVVASGEALPAELVRRFFQVFPDGVRLHNLYGPTEAAVDVSSWDCAPGDAVAAIPIGRPVANTTLDVLDEAMNPLPPGLAGELFIGGVQLALGYRGRPALTAERFVPHPRRPGERLYRTGDLVRRRRDGALVFLGRRDGQVKLRGFRVEVGEIEFRLEAHPAVRAAAVRLWDERLVAYVVPADGVAPHDGDLRAHLGRHLPEHMVPSTFVVVPELPVNANGKLDRSALPTPDRAAERTHTAPRNPVEEKLTALWADLLGRDPAELGVHDDFFDRGGHSLLAARLVARVNHAFGTALSLPALFRAPTVARFAELLSDGPSSSRSPLLVPLRRAVTPAPLFLIHPAGGDVLVYRHLVAALPPGREIIGVQSRALTGEPEHDDIASMAADYARVVRARWSGPYLLAGWSMGGALALEVCALLESQGERVALVAMLDTSSPGAQAEDPLLAPAVALAASGIDPDATAEEASALRRELAGLPLPRRLDVVESWARDRGLAGGFGEAVRRHAELAAVHERLGIGHRAPVVAAPLALYWAAEQLHDRRTAWAEHTRAGVVVEEHLPGNHFTMLRPPHAAEVARRLAPRLDAVTATASGTDPEEDHS